MKKIAIISAFPPSTRTLNEYGLHLAKGFAERDDVKTVTIFADELPDPKEWDLGEKIHVERVWKFNKLLTFWHIFQASRKYKPDLLLFNLQTASFGDKEIPAALGLLSPFFLKLSGQFTGVIAHNMISGIALDDTVLKGQKLRQSIVSLGAKMVDWALMRVNYITVTTQSYYDFYKKTYPAAPFYWVGHGTFDTSQAEYLPIPQRKNRMVTMGKFGTYKRLETLIAAFEIVKKTVPDLELIIGGSDHPNKPGYMKSVQAAHSQTPDLHFQGYVAEEDIPDFFAQAKISLFDYSSTTGSSGVLHQTASYGALPVFPAIGDFVDVSRDEGINGENYEPNNAQSMADAILRVLHDPDNAEKTAQANRVASESLPFSDVINFHMQKIPS